MCLDCHLCPPPGGIDGRATAVFRRIHLTASLSVPPSNFKLKFCLRFKTLHFQFSSLEIWFSWVLQVWAAVGHCRLLWVVLGHSGGGRHGRIEAASAGCTFSALLQKYSPPILFVSPKYSTTQISKDNYSIQKYFFISQYMFCFCSQSYIYILAHPYSSKIFSHYLFVFGIIEVYLYIHVLENIFSPLCLSSPDIQGPLWVKAGTINKVK